jgi:hypothetical protein
MDRFGASLPRVSPSPEKTYVPILAPSSSRSALFALIAFGLFAYAVPALAMQDSEPPNLIASGDTNNKKDVFLYNHTTGTMTLISRSPFTGVSTDGRYVVFESEATDILTSGSVSGTRKRIFVRDLDNDTTALVSQSTGGTDGNDDCILPAISANGRIIAYESEATNLVASDTGGFTDVFWRDNGPLLGDLTGDGCVDGEDLGILLLQWGEGCIAVDLNFDGIVDEDDEDLLTGNYGGDCD